MERASESESESETESEYAGAGPHPGDLWEVVHYKGNHYRRKPTWDAKVVAFPWLESLKVDNATARSRQLLSVHVPPLLPLTRSGMGSCPRVCAAWSQRCQAAGTSSGPRTHTTGSRPAGDLPVWGSGRFFTSNDQTRTARQARREAHKAVLLAAPRGPAVAVWCGKWCITREFSTGRPLGGMRR